MEENLFQHPAGICIYDKLLFVCDCGNAPIRIVDVSRLLSKRKNESVLSDNADDGYETQEIGGNGKAKIRL